MAMSRSLRAHRSSRLRRCVPASPEILSQPGNHPQGGGFGRSGRANQNDEFLVGNIQIDIVNDLERAV